jgi:hypothetical protein
MIFRISHQHYPHKEAGMVMCHCVHDAGLMPNAMDRFLHSNKQEVLFVN